MSRPLDDYDAVFCDLDGCLISGNVVLPGAPALVERLGNRLWILSNNSTDTPGTLSSKLKALGLFVAADRIVLAGTFALETIAARSPGARLAIYGTSVLKEHARALGLCIDDGQPETVLLARDLSFDFFSLERIVSQLSDGAQLIVTNEDLVHPGTDGKPAPETGALLAAVKACLPAVTYECFGKPRLPIYRSLIDRIGVSAEDTLAIGDNPLTDGKGAVDAGIGFVLVGSAGAAHSSVADFLLKGRA